MTLVKLQVPAVRSALAPTDADWIAFLEQHPELTTVNFWTPTDWGVRGLPVGGRLYFVRKGREPRMIAGYGTFVRYELATIRAAWDRYGIGNGVATFDALRDRLIGFAEKRSEKFKPSADPTIGCIILANPVFLPAGDQFAPSDLGVEFPRQVVKLKYFTPDPGAPALAERYRPPDPRSELSLVQSVSDVAERIRQFNDEVPTADARWVRDLLARTTYWAYDSSTDAFAPSKYVSLIDVSLSRYRDLQEAQARLGRVPDFDGTISHNAIEAAVGAPFVADEALAAKLRQWGQAIRQSDALSHQPPHAWKFTTVSHTTTDAIEPPRDREEVLSALLSLETLDSEHMTVGRREQSLYRQLLVGSQAVAKCAICGHDFPVDLLVAAHIKRRADCNDVERRDYASNIMLACRFGCDELFERGYIVVKNGRIHEGPVTSPTEIVRNKVSYLRGKECAHWSTSSAQYFRAHAERHQQLVSSALPEFS